VIEIDKRVLGPNALAQLFAGDKDARLFEQSSQDLEWLPLTAEAHAGFAENTTGKVQLKDRKANNRFVWIWCTHDGLDVLRCIGRLPLSEVV
jgi:hypothetical protein